MKRDRRSERGGRSRRVLIEFKKGNAPEKVKKEQLARYLDRLQGSDVNVVLAHPARERDDREQRWDGIWCQN
jgi:hypothetical protein